MHRRGYLLSREFADANGHRRGDWEVIIIMILEHEGGVITGPSLSSSFGKEREEQCLHGVHTVVVFSATLVNSCKAGFHHPKVGQLGKMGSSYEGTQQKGGKKTLLVAFCVQPFNNMRATA